jgi:3-oxoacyl-[acyl-carrier protein] reductase
VHEFPVDSWLKVFDINVNGLFYCNRAIVPLMLEQGYGRIVNIASVAGKEGNPNASAYSTSKAGVIGLTKSLGKELAKDNITVNAITPAAVRTAIFDQMTQAHIDFMLSKIPIGRFGTVDENAAMICFLASEEASFSTGAVFDTSGGRATY